MENRTQFLQELHDLLEKYNVEISIGIDGDTHGVSTWLTVDHRPNPKAFKYEQILKIDELSSYDLKQHLPQKSLDIEQLVKDLELDK